jgi:hypothetical protein
MIEVSRSLISFHEKGNRPELIEMAFLIGERRSGDAALITTFSAIVVLVMSVRVQ